MVSSPPDARRQQVLAQLAGGRASAVEQAGDRLLHADRHRRIGVDRLGEPPGKRAHLHPDHELVDQLAGARSGDVRTEDRAPAGVPQERPAGGDHLDEAARTPRDDRAIHRREGQRRDMHGVAMRAPRLRLGEADMRDLRLREDDPRNHSIRRRLLTLEGVVRGEPPLVGGHVGERQRAR